MTPVVDVLAAPCHCTENHAHVHEWDPGEGGCPETQWTPTIRTYMDTGVCPVCENRSAFCGLPCTPPPPDLAPVVDMLAPDACTTCGGHGVIATSRDPFSGEYDDEPCPYANEAGH